jgi:FecR protein
VSSMKIILSLFLSLILFSTLFAQDGQGEAAKVAVVSMLRGDVEVMILGKTIKLKKDDWVREGSVVKTAEKSFAKLVFIDKSAMNVGPNSQVKITKFTGNDTGIIDLVKGKIRSQVTKDYLQMKEQGKSKVFIKTPNAVMGIRGTDFMIATNEKTTSAILFEGSVVFAKHDNFKERSTERLENIVNQGVRIHPGEFSVVDQNRNRPTEPAVLNIEQREVLEKSGNFDTERAPDSAQEVKNSQKSVVPEGLDGATVSNNSEVIKTEVQVAAPEVKNENPQVNPNGFIEGDKVKPANGSFVHIDSGTIIPPGQGSVLDANTNTYIPGPGQGEVNNVGEYVPPKNVEITSDGKLMVAFKDETGAIKVQEIPKPAPTIVQQPPVNLAHIGTILTNNPSLVQPGVPLNNDIINRRFLPNGLNDVNNLQQNNTGTSSHLENYINTKSRVIIIGQ